MTTTLSGETTAEILQSVVHSQFPKHALPTIAANHGLTLAELQKLLGAHGYPDKQRMRDHWSNLLRGIDSDGSPHDVTVDALGLEAKQSPYVTALPIADLFVDYAYQRELDERRVQRMVAGYDPALVGIIEVSKRPNDQYAILDGQHRWAMEKDHAFGRTETPHVACRVHAGLTPGEEAQLYHRLNTTRKQLTGWDRWLARRAAGDQGVLDIEATAGECGYRIAMRGGEGVLRATRACETIVSLGGTDLLGQTLGIVRAAYGGDQTALDGAILGGIAYVLDSYGREEVETARLIETLAGIVPRQLSARAAALREVHKGTADRLTAHVIVERYNASKGRKIEPFLERVKPLAKTPTEKVKAERAYREAALAWAVENGFERASGKNSRLTTEIRQAYDAAHEPGAV